MDGRIPTYQCPICDGRNTMVTVGRKEPKHVRVIHAESCARWLRIKELFPRLIAMRLPAIYR